MGKAAEIMNLSRRLPTQEEIESAGAAATALATARTEEGSLVINTLEGEPLRLAPAICELIVDLLGHVTRGDMVTIVPRGALLTTQQAADILNVSRPYLSKLLKDKKIPYIPIGSHRRVRYDDLMAYKQRRDAVREKALDELARLGQEFDAS